MNKENENKKKEKDLLELEREKEEIQERKKKRNRRIKKILIVIGIIIIILLLLRSCDNDLKLPEQIDKVVDGIFDDSQKNEEDVEKETPEEIQERLNEEARKGMITIDINKTPVFQDGTAEGNLLFLNDNYYLIQAEIYRDDTEELIYKSGLIKQGKIIEKAKLNVPLPKGVYECTVYYIAVEPETFVVKGAVGAKMTITILN